MKNRVVNRVVVVGVLAAMLMGGVAYAGGAERDKYRAQNCDEAWALALVRQRRKIPRDQFACPKDLHAPVTRAPCPGTVRTRNAGTKAKQIKDWEGIKAVASSCFKTTHGVKKLYSHKMRQEAKQQEIAFVRAAAAEWKKREAARKQLAARKKMMGEFGELLLTDGLKSIRMHYKVADEIAELEATISAADKVLASYVETCAVPGGGTEPNGDESSDKRRQTRSVKSDE